jgi:hypothetical protein
MIDSEVLKVAIDELAHLGYCPPDRYTDGSECEMDSGPCTWCISKALRTMAEERLKEKQ